MQVSEGVPEIPPPQIKQLLCELLLTWQCIRRSKTSDLGRTKKRLGKREGLEGTSVFRKNKTDVLQKYLS